MTIVRKSGSAPREAGAKMVLRSDGQTAGTVGGGKAELDALEEAKRMLQQPDAGARLLFFDMSNEEAGDAGMVCGGKVEMLLEIV